MQKSSAVEEYRRKLDSCEWLPSCKLNDGETPKLPLYSHRHSDEQTTYSRAEVTEQMLSRSLQRASRKSRVLHQQNKGMSAGGVLANFGPRGGGPGIPYRGGGEGECLR